MAKDKENKEENKKENKKEKDSGKNILMIGVILIVCSIILVGVSVFIMTSTLGKLNTEKVEEVEEEKEPEKIPLSQIESYETENIIIILPSANNPDKRMNFTFYVGFALDKKSKELEKTKTLLEDSKGIIKSRITKLFSTKHYEDMLRPDSQQVIADEILVMMKELLESDVLVEVYIRDFLYR